MYGVVCGGGRRRREAEDAEGSRGVMQHAYSDCWTRTVEQCPDSKSLWRTLDHLLDPPPVVRGPFSTEQFAKFFVNKVKTIQSSTLGAPAPIIRPTSVERF